MDEELLNDIENFRALAMEVSTISRKKHLDEDDIFLIESFFDAINNDYVSISKYIIINPRLRVLMNTLIKVLGSKKEFSDETINAWKSIYYGCIDNLENNIPELLNVISIGDLDSFLAYYYRKLELPGYGVKFLEIIMSNMAYDEFVKSKSFIAYSEQLMQFWKMYDDSDDFQKNTKEEIIEFGKNYIDKLVDSGMEIDFENDIFLKTFPEGQSQLKTYWLLINSKSTDDLSLEELSAINDEIISIFSNTREHNIALEERVK